MARQTYVFWNTDVLREVELSRRQYRRVAKSPDYIAPREQWWADLDAHRTYLVTLPNPRGGPAITWRVSEQAAQWAAATQPGAQVQIAN